MFKVTFVLDKSPHTPAKKTEHLIIYQRFVLLQRLVEGTERYKEQDDRDVLEHVNPLLALALLAGHIYHPENIQPLKKYACFQIKFCHAFVQGNATAFSDITLSESGDI